MTQVSKELFYAIVCNLHLDMITNSILPTYTTHSYPYTNTWKLRYGKVMGKCITRFKDEEKMQYPLVDTYWISHKLIEEHDKYLQEGECLTV